MARPEIRYDSPTSQRMRQLPSSPAWRSGCAMTVCIQIVMTTSLRLVACSTSSTAICASLPILVLLLQALATTAPASSRAEAELPVSGVPRMLYRATYTVEVDC